MPKRVNDIILSPPEYGNLVKQIEAVFRQMFTTPIIFTGSRTSEIYALLSAEIENVSNITLSKSFLLSLMTFKHNRRFQQATYEALQKFVRRFSFLKEDILLKGVQRIYWGVNQGLPAGAYIDSIKGEFIPWRILKKELETKIINAYPKLISPNSRVVLADFYTRKDWLVLIVDKSNNVLGDVWIGNNPYSGWESDGLVRIGKTLNDNSWVVYAIFARLPDGTYKTVRIYTEREIQMLL